MDVLYKSRYCQLLGDINLRCENDIQLFLDHLTLVSQLGSNVLPYLSVGHLYFSFDNCLSMFFVHSSIKLAIFFITDL